MSDDPLIAWMLDQIGPTKRFKSPRHWSLEAGLNHSAVTTVIDRKRATPETLLKLGAVLGKTPREMFVLAGWLNPSEEFVVGPEDWAFLQEVRRLTPDQQTVLRAMPRTIIQLGQGSSEGGGKEGR